MIDELAKDLEEERKELERSLDDALEQTIREAWLPNMIAWLAVAVGGFVLNLLILVLVTAA